MNDRRRRIRKERYERKLAGSSVASHRSGPSAPVQVAQTAAAMARDAAELAESAATSLQDVTTAPLEETLPQERGTADFPREAPIDSQQSNDRELVEHAAVLVEEAAAIVEHAARVVEASDAAAPAVWPHAERRSKPRLFRKREEAHVGWHHVAVYVPLLVLVIIVGALAIWSFIEKQSMAPAPLPLPAVTIVTANAQSPLAAAWARVLTSAELSPTVVSLDQFRNPPPEGVIAICDAPVLPPQVLRALNASAVRGGSVAILGTPPRTPIAGLQLSADAGLADPSATLSQADSPLLARAQPGYAVLTRPVPVAFVRETPGMKVDARWTTSARAALVHIQNGGWRVVWCGINPDSLRGASPEFQLVIRTAFRWLAGQPISAGAAAANAAEAETFSATARNFAKEQGLAYSADPLRVSRALSVTIANRGPKRIANPAVKVWLPPDVIGTSLAGDLFMRRGVTITDVPDEHACIVRVPALMPGAQRTVKVGMHRR